MQRFHSPICSHLLHIYSTFILHFYNGLFTNVLCACCLLDVKCRSIRFISRFLFYFLLPAAKGKKMNVLGLMSLDCKFFSRTFDGTINSDEIRWRFIKYQWMPFDAYNNFQNLKERLNQTLKSIGSKCIIKFYWVLNSV